jgi:glutamate-1-semialdehyde 2,1-aminomutase
VVAGGLPGACVGGRAEILDMIQHRENRGWNNSSRVSHPGTFNANPLSAAAGSTCLELIAAEPIVEKTHAAADAIRAGMNEVLRKQKVRGLVHGHGSEGFVVFDVDYDGDLGEHCAVPHEAVLASIGSQRTALFRKALLNHGVDVMNGYWLVFSSVLGKEEIDHVLEAFDRSLSDLKACGALGE